MTEKDLSSFSDSELQRELNERRRRTIYPKYVSLIRYADGHTTIEDSPTCIVGSTTILDRVAIREEEGKLILDRENAGPFFIEDDTFHGKALVFRTITPSPTEISGRFKQGDE